MNDALKKMLREPPSDKIFNSILASLNRRAKLEKGGRKYELLADSDIGKNHGFISTRNIAIDRIVSGRSEGGGLPIGRIVELAGDPSAGKSLIISQVIAECQSKGGVAVLQDTERAYDLKWMHTLGVTDQLITSDPDTIEQGISELELAIDDVRDSIEEDRPVVIATDSIAFLSTQHELDTGMDKMDMGMRAKLIRQGMRILLRKIQRKRILFIVANHFTTGPGRFVAKTTTPGGSGVPFGASVRIELSLGKQIREAESAIKRRDPIALGTKVHVYVGKSRVGPSYREAIVDVLFDRGIEPLSGLLEVLQMEGRIQTKGMYYWLTDFPNEKFKRKQFNTFYMEHRKEMDKPIVLKSVLDEVGDDDEPEEIEGGEN